jgi:hypothetical protein
MNICELIRQIRGELTQEKFGLLVWPDDPPELVRGRIAKYENGFAIPPGDILLRIQLIGTPPAK